ncbi:swr complex subunit [Mycoblastus sanguinarius]|nr:swr complex subunit [Mycoblastus sanguinarius]
MPPLPPPDKDAYNSASDSDFDASLSPSSGDESDASGVATTTATKGNKRKIDNDGDVHMGSGDEGIVAQGRKKRRRKVKARGKGKEGEGDEVLEEEGEEEGREEDLGVGVRVRLRSGRGGEDTKKVLPKTGGATIDIDSVWARMNSPQTAKPVTAAQQFSDTASNAENILPSLEPLNPTSSSHETVTIPHTYTFAGQTHTSTKTVPASSPEALAYLSSKGKEATPTTGPSLRRPLARRNLLDPNPTCLIRGRQLPPRSDLPLSIGGKGTGTFTTMEKRVSEWGLGKDKAKKLNTVEKSKVDWEEEVERQGIREELEKAERSGGSYLGRMEFLGRVESGKEEEARAARLKMSGVGG